MTRRLFYLILLLLLKDCSSERTSRIAFGKTASKHQFPFFAQVKQILPNEDFVIGMRKKILQSDETLTAWCSASLISPQWILTAGHCFSNDKKRINHLIKTEAILVLMGTNKKNDPEAVVRSVVEVQIHPKFSALFDENDPTHTAVEHIENDIALAKLKSSYELSKSIKTILLPTSKSPRCKSGTIIGIGDTPLGHTTYVVFATVSTTGVDDLGQYVPPVNTTFYSLAENKQGYTMHGDSGGPFVCSFEGSRVQYGVISTTLPSVTGGYINTYADVQKYKEFIQGHVKEAQFYEKPAEHSQKSAKKNFPLEFGGPLSNAEAIQAYVSTLTLLVLHCVTENLN